MTTDSATVFAEERSAGTDQVRAIVDRTKSVYSLPAVAVEVIQLTSNPQVDVQALKECIENDPALTAKLLRVVNSSLFGLSSEVRDLNQALALMGVKPLKLLVLGFSLPEELFARVAREQLTWYWKRSLVRAVTAREITQRYWQKPGDDAFLAGLLEDIGVLVLLDQLRDPYAKFLSHVIESNCELGTLEQQTLGFDHRTLSASLLRDWKLPKQLVDAIAEERNIELLSGGNSPTKELAQILHLASLMAELVGHNRLKVLPELLSAGSTYCGFDKDKLHEIVPDLQIKVAQLAEVLSLDLAGDVFYLDIISEAHRQMALLSEEVSGPLSQLERGTAEQTEQLNEQAGELRAALSGIVDCPVAPADVAGGEVTQDALSAATKATEKPTSSAAQISRTSHQPYRSLTLAAGLCRSRRAPLSLLIISCNDLAGSSPEGPEQLRECVDNACHSVDWAQLQVEKVGELRWQLILPRCERHQAVRIANDVFQTVQDDLHPPGGECMDVLCSLSAGVASVALPPRNFHPPDMVDAAQRCLYAAELSDANVVKSIEIF